MPCVTDADCNDNLFCDGVETCVAGLCAPGVPPLNCNDGTPAPTTSATRRPRPASTSSTTTTAPTASSATARRSATRETVAHDRVRGRRAASCNDAVPCTADACNEALKKCDHIPNNIACTDGIFCKRREVCDPVMGCVPACR